MMHNFVLAALRLAGIHALICIAACAPVDGPDRASGLAGEQTSETKLTPAKASDITADIAFISDTQNYLLSLEKSGFAAGLLIARGDHTLIHDGYGMANREAGIQWSPDTISTIGSITKQFTGAAILLLQEDGLLNVNDPITKYFSLVPEDKSAITVHQLLTHSSGLTDPPVGDWDPIEREEYVRQTLQRALKFEPGTSYEYTNAGFSLLATIIEQLTGDSYETFLRQRLFLPSGMKDTGYQLAGWDESRLAIGYRGDESWGTVVGRPMAEDGPYWALRGNGGIHSTTADMLLWAKGLIRGNIMSSTSRDAYWAPHVDEGFGDSHYGYGWVNTKGPGGRRLITHNGGNNIMFADIAIYPAEQVVIVLQTNVAADWPEADVMLEQVALRLFEGEVLPSVPAAAEIAAPVGPFLVAENSRK